MKKLLIALLAALPLSAVAETNVFNGTVVSLTTNGSPTGTILAVDMMSRPWPPTMTCRDRLVILSTEHSLIGAARASMYAQHEVRFLVEDTTPGVEDYCSVRQIRAQAVNLP